MSAYQRQLELAAELTAAGITATADPRGATPPCVLVAPPERDYDLACGYTARWQLWALAPGPGNADAAKLLDDIVDQVAKVLPIEHVIVAQYALSPDNPALPAHRLDFTEGIST